MNEQHLRIVAFVVLCTLHVGVSQISYTESVCKQILEEANFRECCNMPRLLSDEVFQRCDNRTLPPVPPDVPAPIPANCQAECVLNETGILVHRQFMLEQAVKVLVGQVPADNITWMRAFEVAARKCYNLVMTRTFYLQDVAKNLISSQCIPTSIRYLECTFSIIYRDCPDAYWNYNNEQCKGIVVALNNCYYLFQHVWKI